MNTDTSRNPPVTEVTKLDRGRIAQLLERLGPLVKLHDLGRYKTLTSEEIWAALVTQVCVMGSARGIEALIRAGNLGAFNDAVALSTLALERRPAQYLAKTLRGWGATRFPVRSGSRLAEVLKVPPVVRGGVCVLLEGLSDGIPADTTRRTLMARCPIFKMKSASDFMITVGLSRDVIALDVRVVGALQKYLGYNLKAGQVQARREVYLSVEQALREVCTTHDSTLAHLDRALFQFGGMSALEFVLQHFP